MRTLCRRLFLAAWLSINRYDAARPFLPWLRTITLNKCRDHARCERVRRLLLLARAREPEETLEGGAPERAYAQRGYGSRMATNRSEDCRTVFRHVLRISFSFKTDELPMGSGERERLEIPQNVLKKRLSGNLRAAVKKPILRNDFVSVARRLESDESEKAFDAALRDMGRANPENLATKKAKLKKWLDTPLPQFRSGQSLSPDNCAATQLPARPPRCSTKEVAMFAAARCSAVPYQVQRLQTEAEKVVSRPQKLTIRNGRMFSESSEPCANVGVLTKPIRALPVTFAMSVAHGKR